MKNKFINVLSFVLLSSSILIAQEQVEPDLVTDSYSRSSISPITITYSDSYDSYVKSGVNAIDFGGKFDFNEISTTSLNVNGDRKTTSDSAINKRINELNIGRDIISYWFNRKSDGSMDDSRMQQRSRYNATDQDVLNDQAAKVKTIADMGNKLLKNSYILAFDAKELEIRTSTNSKTGKTTKSHYVSMNAYVYQIDITEDFLNSIYTDIWIYDDDDSNTKAQKKKNFENLIVPMKLVASTSVSSSAEEGYTTAVTNSYEDLLRKLEKKIKEWQVTTPVYQVHPIMAKIGKKEGLKNGARYAVYKYVEDKNGNLTTTKRGFVRATTIADNEGVASGESAMSRFYQISGHSIKEGMLLKQSNDMKMGVSLAPVLGGYSFANLRVDYLAHITNHGCVSHVLVNFGADLADMYDNTGNDLDCKWMYINGSIGYGFGIPLTRKFEFQPYLAVGADYILLDEDDYSVTDDDGAMGFFGEGGLRFSVTPVYPVSIFAQAGYSLLFKEGVVYEFFDQSKSSFLGLGDNRFGLGLSLGIRAAF